MAGSFLARVVAGLRAALACLITGGVPIVDAVAQDAPLPVAAAAQSAPSSAAVPGRAAVSSLPSFADLEAAGAVIGEIRVRADDIFDTTQPEEDKPLFRWANALHVQTRPRVIRQALLFAPGDRVNARVIDETERLLRSHRYLYDVRITPLAVRDGVVDLEVATRDTWSITVGGGVAVQGGSSGGSVGLTDVNVLGAGIALGIGREKNVDRTSSLVRVSMPRAFGSRVNVDAGHASADDGRRSHVAVVRPFYALDTRWAAGVTATKDDRIDSTYREGEVAAEHRHRLQQAEVWGGWSAGLVDGRTRRYTVGVGFQDDTYALEPGAAAPVQLPTARRLVTPFVRHETFEDRFVRTSNRNSVGRPEFFATGLTTAVQLGYASTTLGAGSNGVVASGSVTRGFAWGDDTLLMASLRGGVQHSEGAWRKLRLGAQGQVFQPHGPHRLTYASLALDALARPDPLETLLLGGDSGLRGYPVRYQSGTRRALVTLEERYYTDWYLWQLFRFGFAAYVDAGRAWGGDATYLNREAPGWLADAGVGLRIVSARAAVAGMLHVDVAAPLRARGDVKRVQVLVRTRASF